MRSLRPGGPFDGPLRPKLDGPLRSKLDGPLRSKLDAPLRPRRWGRGPLLGFLFLVAGCGGEGAEEEQSFATDVAPLLDLHCTGRCHVPEDPDGGFLLLEPHAAYEELVSVPSQQAPALQRVEPGDLEGSYLWHKLVGTHLDVGGEGEPMPYAAAPLAPKELETIENWIRQGARP